MITVLYFARFREKLGRDRETLPLPSASPVTVQVLLDELVARGGVWSDVLGCERGVLVAVNQQMAQRDSLLREGDEIALFPPVTGG
jgi:molybdopterin synthase sulfur carrier subunit